MGNRARVKKKLRWRVVHLTRLHLHLTQAALSCATSLPFSLISSKNFMFYNPKRRKRALVLVTLTPCNREEEG